MKYTPDKWVILKITTPEEVLYKVFATWSGGYLHGDSWKVNSGIESVDIQDDYFLFSGYSGSIYKCHKDTYGLSTWGVGMITSLQELSEGMQIEVLEEDIALELFGKEK